MLDPDENMDLCCFGAMGAKKGVFIIGILEIIGVLVVVLKVVVDCIVANTLALTLLLVMSFIALANIGTILLMFCGVKKGKAYLVSAHLIVHVVNIISLVFALLMSSMFFVVVNTEAAVVTGSSTSAPQVDSDTWGNIKWAIQISVSTICLIMETWFFNVEYTIFLQLCNRNQPKLSFTPIQNPKGVHG